jgi:flagellar motility protein MotE (MotC chaperone)
MDNSHSEGSNGTLEKFLVWFLIPLVFTSVLLGVLLSIFDYDVMNNLFKAAGKIPVINHVLPGPKSPDNGKTANADDHNASGSPQPSLEAEVVRLNQKIAAQEAELQKTSRESQAKDQTIQDLKAAVDQLQQKLQEKTLSNEEYDNQIQQLASTYAKMMPSKAAPVLENLSLQERVLVLNAMKTDDRVKVLEKMDPKIAAESSIALKDVVPVKDQEIAALQSRLKINGTDPNTAGKLSREDMGATFASMDPKNAATVLVQMMNSNAAQVASILQSMDAGARSQILSEMAGISRDAAAKIVSQLGM